MDMNDNELRQLYRSFVSGKIRAAMGECPPVEGLRKAFETATPRRVKGEIVDHISDCPDCAREFEFIREARPMEKELAALIHKLARLRRPPVLFLPRPLRSYAIGVLMIAVVITGVVVHKHDRARDEGRSRSTSIPESLAPAGHIAAPPPLIFRWKPVIRAVSYVVEVYDDALQPVWESPPVSTTAAILPDPIRASLSGDKNYYWLVLAFDSEGKIGESTFEAFSFDP
jgi:hypothetical protein